MRPPKFLTKTGYYWVRQQNSNKRRKTGPPGYLYIHTHATTHAQSHAVKYTNTHTLHSSQYISSTYTHWRKLQHAHALTFKTYLTLNVYIRAHTYLHICIFIHMQMLITLYTHAYTHTRTHAHTHTNKQTRARMHTLRNTENFTYHIRRK